MGRMKETAPDLFSHRPPPHVRNSPTSKAAAESMAKPAHAIRTKIIVWFKDVGTVGMTCDELEVAMDLRHQTASARIVELVASGHLVKTERTRLTRSARSAAVYVISP
jgi:hypothetical protein